jgi:lipoyl-dependent peroxiredoxin
MKRSFPGSGFSKNYSLWERRQNKRQKYRWQSIEYSDDYYFYGQIKRSPMKRKATAVWKGSGKDGTGHLSTQSTVLERSQYSSNSRFAEGKGTNPEELVAAAHAGCFSMKLSFILADAGFTPDELSTECFVTIDNGTVTQSELKLTAKIPGISKEKFQACADEAKKTCPISKLLNTNITLEANLI